MVNEKKAVKSEKVFWKIVVFGILNILYNFKNTIIPEHRSPFTTSRGIHREVFFEKSCYWILENIMKGWYNLQFFAKSF